MTIKNNRSRALKALSAASVLALGAAVLTGCSAATTAGGCELGSEQDGDLVLKLGTALPLTGNLAFLGPPEEAGAALAIDEINAANKGISLLTPLLVTQVTPTTRLTTPRFLAY